jgi:hypothetical protein
MCFRTNSGQFLTEFLPWRADFGQLPGLRAHSSQRSVNKLSTRHLQIARCKQRYELIVCQLYANPKTVRLYVERGMSVNFWLPLGTDIRQLRFCRVSEPKEKQCRHRHMTLRWTDLSCQCIKLVSKRHAIAALHYELTFANHVHEFNAGQDWSCRAKWFKAKHRADDAFGGTVILLHDIVELFDLPNLDQDFSLRIQLVERCLVGATLVHRHRVRDITMPHGSVEEAPGRWCISFCG